SSFKNIQKQGWEYGEATATDGTHHVGWARYDDAALFSEGVYWYQEHTSPLSFGAVSLLAIHGDHQFGSASSHATMWSGSGASSLDLHPPVASKSLVRDASLGLQAGWAEIGASHAAVWAGCQETFVDLHPAGASSSTLRATHGGVQVGSIVTD